MRHTWIASQKYEEKRHSERIADVSKSGRLLLKENTNSE